MSARTAGILSLFFFPVVFVSLYIRGSEHYREWIMTLSFIENFQLICN